MNSTRGSFTMVVVVVLLLLLLAAIGAAVVIYHFRARRVHKNLRAQQAAQEGNRIPAPLEQALFHQQLEVGNPAALDALQIWRGELQPHELDRAGMPQPIVVLGLVDEGQPEEVLGAVVVDAEDDDHAAAPPRGNDEMDASGNRSRRTRHRLYSPLIGGHHRWDELRQLVERSAYHRCPMAYADASERSTSADEEDELHLMPSPDDHCPFASPRGGETSVFVDAPFA